MLKIPCGGFKLDESSFVLDKETLSTQPVSWDSLKDKPFGEEVSLSDLEVLLPLAEHPMKYMGSGYGDWGEEKIELVVGETYTVLFNSVEYVCVAQYVPNSVQYIYLGAPYSSTDNGCPFSFVVTPTNWTCSLTLSYEGTGVETFTLAVYKGKSVIKTIDPKFIKDMYGEIGSLDDLEVLLPLGVYTADSLYAGHGVQKDEPMNLVVGETYTVLFNGAEYTCVAQPIPDFEDGVYIGAFLDEETPTMPFHFRTEYGEYWCFLVADYSIETFSFAVYKGAVRIKTIDPKYLPGGHVVIPVTLNDDSTMTVDAGAATVQKACDSYKNGGSVAISYNMGEATFTTNAISLMEMGGGAVSALSFTLSIEGAPVGVAMIGVSPDGIIAEVQTNS